MRTMLHHIPLQLLYCAAVAGSVVAARTGLGASPPPLAVLVPKLVVLTKRRALAGKRMIHHPRWLTKTFETFWLRTWSSRTSPPLCGARTHRRSLLTPSILSIRYEYAWATLQAQVRAPCRRPCHFRTFSPGSLSFLSLLIFFRIVSISICCCRRISPFYCAIVKNPKRTQDS